MGPHESPTRQPENQAPLRRKRSVRRPRIRRCLLKGCEERFHPRRARQRYCSERCRLAAREWSRWKAQQKYRATAAGKRKRNGQSCRYRERVKKRNQTPREEAVPQQPPAIGTTPRSPWQAHMASLASSHLFAAHGFPTSAGGFVPGGMRIAGSGFGFGRSANGGHVYTPSAASSGFGRSGAGHWGGGGGHFSGPGGGHSAGGGFGGHSGGGGHR
jgi:hypothetical protein